MIQSQRKVHFIYTLTVVAIIFFLKINGSAVLAKLYPSDCRPNGIYNGDKQICMCDRGYIFEEGHCIKACAEECPQNAECVGKNKCDCRQGYEKVNITYVDSIFDCKSKEEQCKKGYRPPNEYDDVIDEKCVPNCEKPCGFYQICTAPNHCSCKPNYEKTAEGKCKPKCEPGCGDNSYCEQPNKCECFENYRKDDVNGNCVPVCKEECGENFICIPPDRCVCKNGYAQATPYSPCKSVCDACVENSDCIGVNQCQCKAGYRALYKDRTEGIIEKCEPICYTPPDCGLNADCVAPDICRCQQGYTNSTAGICRPTCILNNCPEHATCIAPEECQCDLGYMPSNGMESKCLPICQDIECEDANSYCSAPNVCDCKKGYARNPKIIASKCLPTCSNGCAPNAVCVAPDVCGCNSGYNMTINGLCQPVCTPNCPTTIATCIENNICECLEADTKKIFIAATTFSQASQICSTTSSTTDADHNRHYTPTITQHPPPYQPPPPLLPCLRDLNLIFTTTKVSCDFNGFLIFLIYVAIVGSGIVFIFMTIKIYQYVRRKFAEKKLSNQMLREDIHPRLNYIITYRPENRQSIEETHLDGAALPAGETEPSYTPLQIERRPPPPPYTKRIF